MKGSVLKRCSCPPAYSAKGERLACKIRHGSWSLVLGVKDPSSGKRRQIRQSGYPTKDAAERALAELADQANRGIVPAKRRETFETYSAGWLESRALKVRRNTLAGYRFALAHARRSFGSAPLGDLRRTDVERLVRELADKGRAQRTVALTLFVVKSVLASALDEGLVARNVAANVGAAGRPAKDRGALPAGELAKLRAHVAGDRLGACWLLTLYGLRRSELLGLNWTDVDLAAGVLTVDHGVVADDTGRRNARRRHRSAARHPQPATAARRADRAARPT